MITADTFHTIRHTETGETIVAAVREVKGSFGRLLEARDMEVPCGILGTCPADRPEPDKLWPGWVKID